MFDLERVGRVWAMDADLDGSGWGLTACTDTLLPTQYTWAYSVDTE